MPSHLILAALLMFAAAQPDETLRRYGAADHEWQLVTLRDAPFDATATIQFPERGVVTGTGPCNSFRSSNTTPYPWIEIGPIAATRRACPSLDQEVAYFEALRTAQIALIQGDTLTLSTEDAPVLVFKAGD